MTPMRSRAARLTWSLSTWIVFGAAAIVLIQSEERLSRQKIAVHAFDDRARRVIDALASLRVAQSAYVAPGQSLSTWAPQAASHLQDVSDALGTLQSSVTSPDGASSLLAAVSAVAGLVELDGRIREDAHDGDTVMAADIAFSEGTERTADASEQVEAARVAEHQRFDASEASTRRLEAYAAGGSALFAALTLFFLGWTTTSAERDTPETMDFSASSPSADTLLLRSDSPSTTSPHSAASELTLASMADLCTNLARADGHGGLQHLLGSIGETIDATGIVVWLGNTQGSDLRAVMAWGYSDEMVARLPVVPRSADNAAAGAYRTGELQVVRSHGGTSKGAIAAPILSPGGCIGAFTAELRNHGETSDGVQAVAGLVAAQLAPILTTLGHSLPSPAESDTPHVATA